MSQSPDANSTATASGDRDVQRAALRDLVALSADSATEETRIEETHREQALAADKKLQNILLEIEQRHQSQKEQIDADYQQRLTKIAQEYQTAQAELESYDIASRQRLDYEHDAIAQDVRGKLQQAIWLAESVYEATQNQINKEYAAAKEMHRTREEELNANNTEMMALLARYGQTNIAAVNPPSAPANESAAYESCRDEVQRRLKKLEHLFVPRLFVGVRPFIVFAAVCVVAAFLTQWATGGLPIDFGTFELKGKAIAYALGGSIVGCAIAGALLWMLGKSQVRGAYIPLRAAIDAAHQSADRAREEARQHRDSQLSRATKKRDLEVQAVKEKFAPLQARAAKNREAAKNSARAEHDMRVTKVESQHHHVRKLADDWLAQSSKQNDQSRDRDIAAANAEHQSTTRNSTQQYEKNRTQLETRWTSGLDRIQTPIEENLHSGDGRIITDWDDPRWQSWLPPKIFPPRVRFGELQVDLKQITDRYPRELTLPASFSVPATLSFPERGSLLINTDHAGRAEAIATQQMLMARLLTHLPPGRVRFTIIDPVGLGQNFAGFMHLADHDEALVGTRIWTESEHIEQQLANLTEHMETVIQKYLRNEFATIDQYNAQAGELAEPYRYLVIADFPVGFEGDAFRRLNSIAISGARCGVFTLIVRDTRKPLPSGVHLDELESQSVNLIRKNDRFVWKDEIFKQFPLTLDPPPSEEFLTQILDVVGQKAKEAKRVEVPFEAIAPRADQIWSGNSQDDIAVPIGRLGATRLQMLRLGRGVAQHALIAGKTGSGKSTLLHVLVTNLALWYGPDEVEFYLVDFKKGVEFKTYATHVLPHARAIAVESDREFGLSVLHRIDAELARRGELFRKLGVQDLAAYRQQSKQPMPRTLLIIDEFQEFFSEDDKLAQEASLLLDRLVRQGRAFGIHVLLGSQTIGGTSGLARSTIGQMAVRIALQTSEADSQLILGDANSAARLLSRPG
ncbi:MAG TPA: FtsK/SpoIIIE domain-containing protein, partial [Tepidisphaeraceae bacterium]|nr:FtsK/SpoIIIE domain-containing protein [Tepidisphaeraceae bacterium]